MTLSLADAVDAVLEGPIVPSFTRLGCVVRSCTDDWQPLDEIDLRGRTVVLTGATSGLGLAAARRLAASGADLVLSGRDRDKAERVRDELAAESGNDRLSVAIADMGELEQVRAMAAELRATHPRIDVLVHNAGALLAEKRQTSDDNEVTLAVHVLGPFVLTHELLEPLRAGDPGRVLTMSSGGMYTAPLTVDDLEMADDAYSGSEQYARAKRAQVTLNEMWADRMGDEPLRFHALHPGWADTPGIGEALPGFSKVMGPLLRSPDEGADTLVWLASTPVAVETNGRFWFDRRPRSIHRLGSTRRTDTPERRAELWDWCLTHTGLEGSELALRRQPEVADEPDSGERA